MQTIRRQNILVTALVGAFVIGGPIRRSRKL